MAPSHPNFAQMIKRQDTSSNSTGSGDSSASGMPTCVSACIFNAPTAGCSGATDWTCLCASTEFISAVDTCWSQSCSADDYAYGQAYANQACTFYGVPIGGSSNTTTGGTTSPDTQATGSPVMTPPRTIHHSFVKVQAIMSSITSLMLVIALILGCLSCRARYKREQASSQNRTWNGVTGLTTMDSKAPSKSKFFDRSQHSSAFGNSRNATTTFQSENFGVTSSNFGGSTTLASSGGLPTSPTFSNDTGLSYPAKTQSKFTNRLTLDQLNHNNKSEEWELSNINNINLNRLSKKEEEELDGFNDISPTSFDSKMESEMESRLNEHENQYDNHSGIDSTVALNVLPKEGQGKTHAM